MKYIFIYNPNAGKLKRNATFKKDLASLKEEYGDDIICYETKCPGDATDAAKSFCEQYRDEMITVFACGGDGTMYEVLNGVVGYKNCNFGVIPTGSCNDFLKIYPFKNFLNLKKMVKGNVIPCDVIKANDHYCLNVTNIGFDARVNADQIRFRATDKTVKKAYNHAILKNLFASEFDSIVLKVDGKTAFKGESMLIAVGNAQYYGGGYRCCPKAKIDDGLADVFIVKKVSIPRFALLIGPFKKGLLYGKKKKIIQSERGQLIRLRSKKEFTYCIDGETFYSKNLRLEVIKHAINLVLPK